MKNEYGIPSWGVHGKVETKSESPIAITSSADSVRGAVTDKRELVTGVPPIPGVARALLRM